MIINVSQLPISYMKQIFSHHKNFTQNLVSKGFSKSWSLWPIHFCTPSTVGLYLGSSYALVKRLDIVINRSIHMFYSYMYHYIITNDFLKERLSEPSKTTSDIRRRTVQCDFLSSILPPRGSYCHISETAEMRVGSLCATDDMPFVVCYHRLERRGHISGHSDPIRE